MAKSAQQVTTKQIKTRLDELLKAVRYTYSPTESTCVTCHKTFPIKELQAGHFIKRGNLWLKYHPHNIYPQCRRCNHFMGGCQDKMAYHIIRSRPDGLEIFYNLIEKDFRWQNQPKRPTLKKNELIHHYNYWLEVNRKIEAKFDIKIIPKSWDFL